MPVCRKCGHENADDNRFCASCGSALMESSIEVTSTISTIGANIEPDDVTAAPGPVIDLASLEALSVGTAILVVARGPNAGSRFLLDSETTTVGRHPESDIFLDDVTVSRRHAEFRRQDDGRFVVSDVGSLNGTYVNRTRIDDTSLNGGDEVQIGKYRLVFHPSARAAGAADATDGSGS
jgi:pSer/pThr/pTyr-binding forkhead associated (FHA) protein